jgi:hypothetical protein
MADPKVDPVDEREAWDVLGLPPSATIDEARAAYRRLVRTHHPDVAGVRGAARTARVIDAWHVVRDRAVEPAARDDGGPVHVDAIGDTVTLEVPPDEAFLLVLDAAHRIGDVTHVGPGDGLLEALIAFADGRTCSLVISLQGRGAGVTEAFCTLQALDAGPTPPIDSVVDALVEELATSTSTRARRARD